MVICTGEDLPTGHSIQARLVIIEVDRERLNLPALGLLVGGAIAAAAFHNDILAATFAGAAAGFAVNRDPERAAGTSPPLPGR